MGRFIYDPKPKPDRFNWVRDPRQLPFSGCANIYILGSSFAGSDSTIFFTSGVANRGAIANVLAADTFVTVVSLSGAGVLCNVISSVDGVTPRQTIRITVDGSQYTLTPATNLTNINAYRLLLGYATPGVSGTVASQVPLPTSSLDPGFAQPNVSRMEVGITATLVRPALMLDWGFPVLRFDSSCLVEVKGTTQPGDPAQQMCGATYIMD